MWETAGNRRYYYRYRTERGRSRRIYVGCGPLAELAAALDEQERAERQDERAAWAAAGVQCDRLLPSLLNLDDDTNILTTAALYASGFHQFERHWRLRHDHRAD